MRRLLTVAVVGSLAGAASLNMSGCGNITPDQTLAQALQTLSQNPLLSQITVGDLAAAFQQFAAQAGYGRAPRLTADQQKQLEDLQAQLDAGTISQEDFEKQAQAVIGDAAPGVAFGGFGFFGSPFGHQFRGPLSGDLALTDDQKAQARDVFDAAHTDIDALRMAAHDDILNNVLTQEQRDTLARLQADHPRLPIFGNASSADANARGGRGPGGPGGFGPGGPAGFVPGGPGGPAIGRGPVGQLIRDRIAQALALTDDQKAKIEQIRSDLRDAVKARHELAREQFRAILTPEQLAALDAFEADHPMPEIGDDSK